MNEARSRFAMLGAGVAALLLCGVAYRGHNRPAPPIVITDSVSHAVVHGNPRMPGLAAAMVPAAVRAAKPAPAISAAPPAVSLGTEPAVKSGAIVVDVAGAVRHPGIVALSHTARVANALRAAGGPTRNADLDMVNLAEPVVDGEKIFVPTAAVQTDNTPITSVHQISAPKLPPIVAMPAPPNSTPAAAALPPSPNALTARSASRSNKFTDPSQEQVDLNSASAEDLQRIPGIGPAMAARIIAYRQQSGGFKALDDLKQVGGIGDKKLLRIAPFVIIR